MGTIQCLGAVNLPGILARFHASHPGVRIERRQDGSTDLIERVRTGDLGPRLCLRAPDGAAGVALSPVAEEPLLLVCSPAPRPTHSGIATPSIYTSSAMRLSSTSTPAG